MQQGKARLEVVGKLKVSAMGDDNMNKPRVLGRWRKDCLNKQEGSATREALPSGSMLFSVLFALPVQALCKAQEPS